MIELTTEQLTARRDELLGALHLASYDEFRERADAGILTDREWAHRNELDSLAYLLGEDDLTD
ncbi:hypothetical protein M4I32_10885 [Microbacterium sp. LRZ72]|uniref:hypothetical protein n=1 Tax=Microbacterium sp. LRZ72 TaxID=2942481 RepID=UPI0029A0E7CA|nr:hypothetical protein [Microbacterium sp. LRZ72]MDX2377304.1 hypothetical protein [Microbacterium sp. LRZ72]